METQKHPEVATPEAEQAQEQEQTPEQFRKSLDIFDKYRKVSEAEAKKPEYEMGFNKHEQGLVVGLRGALNEFIDEATENEESVNIPAMFDRLDAAIRAQAENTPEETLDQLYLVATKMRYNLQVRFDHKQRSNESESHDVADESPITTKELFKKMSGRLKDLDYDQFHGHEDDEDL